MTWKRPPSMTATHPQESSPQGAWSSPDPTQFARAGHPLLQSRGPCSQQRPNSEQLRSGSGDRFSFLEPAHFSLPPLNLPGVVRATCRGSLNGSPGSLLIHRSKALHNEIRRSNVESRPRLFGISLKVFGGVGLHANKHGEPTWKHLSLKAGTPQQQTAENFGNFPRENFGDRP